MEKVSKKKGIIDLKLSRSCPQGYPWVCSACMRKAGLTIPCSGRKQ